MCLFPLTATLPPEGGRPKLDSEGSLKLPCGKCSECISKRALEWATRAKHEISTHKQNSFITLTYNPQNLPSNFIIKTDFQKFIKKLRKKTKNPFRYMVSYEYGSKNFRPHMHALLFGYNPNKQTFLKNTPSGHPLYTSPGISELWDKGFHSIGEANEKTAYYIASYALKGNKKSLYHPDTGEYCTLSDCMNVSTRPGIGLKYFLKNAEQLVNSGEVLPRYYQKKLEVINPALFEQYQNKVTELHKTRSSGELYAKFVINDQKIHSSASNFRENLCTNNRSDQSIEKLFQKDHLKYLRDNYVSFNNKE